jgi:hypothetical protein
MPELCPDEPSIATAGAARTVELASGGIDPVIERRRAHRERRRPASVKARPGESQYAPPPPELRASDSIITAPNKIMSVQS